MTTPARFLSGTTPAAVFQPLGNIGTPDPFFYASFEDDFLPYNSANYTVTATGGSVAATSGVGGRILLTTGAVAGNFAELQQPAAGFLYTAGLRLAFLCRLQVTNATTSALVAGLCPTTATPFGTITDGIYFTKAAGSTNVTLQATTTSASIGSVVVGTLTNATDYDLGFYVDRKGNIIGFFGNNLEGYKRQDFAVLGPTAKILSSSLTGVLTTVSLNPTLAVSNGATAAAMTGISDFFFAAMER